MITLKHFYNHFAIFLYFILYKCINNNMECQKFNFCSVHFCSKEPIRGRVRLPHNNHILKVNTLTMTFHNIAIINIFT